MTPSERLIEKGRVTILIPVHFTGRGATKQRVHKIIQRDNSLQTGDLNTSIRVVYTKTPIDGVMNTLDISPRQDAKMCGAAGECVNALGWNKGHINSRNSGENDAGPNEGLHFAGDTDRYEEQVNAGGNRLTLPSPGYDETNIMSSRAGTTLKPEQLDEVNKNDTTKHCRSVAGVLICH